MALKNLAEVIKGAVDIVSATPNPMVGRTRLQKTAYLLEISGLGVGFPFEYKHYGPFSQRLADATQMAVLFGQLNEEKKAASWGGSYSIFSTDTADFPEESHARTAIIDLAKDANAIELELAATAAFLAKAGFADPWSETASRKPEKVGGGRLDRAKHLYEEFAAIKTPIEWPEV